MPSPADLPNPGIEPGSLALQVDSLPSELSEKSKKKKKTTEEIALIVYVVKLVIVVSSQ